MSVKLLLPEYDIYFANTGNFSIFHTVLMFSIKREKFFVGVCNRWVNECAMLQIEIFIENEHER